MVIALNTQMKIKNVLVVIFTKVKLDRLSTLISRPTSSVPNLL